MIDLTGTNWKIYTRRLNISNKLLEFKANGLVCIRYKAEGTYTVQDDLIQINILRHILSGYIIEGSMFGDIISKNPILKFETSCQSFDCKNEYIKNLQGDNVGGTKDFFPIYRVFQLINGLRVELYGGNRVSMKLIKSWVDQFNENLRIPILSELKKMLKSNYFSINEINEFLEALFSKFHSNINFRSARPIALINTMVTLPSNRNNQSLLLNLFYDLLRAKYGVTLIL